MELLIAAFHVTFSCTFDCGFPRVMRVPFCASDLACDLATCLHLCQAPGIPKLQPGAAQAMQEGGT